jgi:SAM-dependent methyltransferase
LTTVVFDERAAQYDAWYDTPLGAACFSAELDALAPLMEGLSHPILEVGVGSGRFASALGADVGVDPVAAPLRLAAGRGVSVALARGEALPYRAATFGGVLFVVTLCFMAHPLRGLREARRVLRTDGKLVLGLVPADSPWGRHYQTLAARGDEFYRHARFYTRAETATLLRQAAFRIERARSALFWPPEGQPLTIGAREGTDPQAGFWALRGSAITAP